MRSRGATTRATPQLGQDLRAVPADADREQRARLRRPAAEDGRAVRRAGRPRRATPDRFRFLLVDEYQDTNRPQYLLMRRLAEAHRNICVVGDPDQSIYKWRGADLRNIMDFEADYPDAKVVRLERNYRSTQVILDAASAVISQNRNRKEKRLWTETKGGDKVRYYLANDELEEAEPGRARRARGGAHAPATRRWRSCTGPTPSRASSKTRCAARASPTASSAASGSTSARKSRTRWRT